MGVHKMPHAFGRKYLEAAEDRGSVPMGHHQEMTYGGSIGHVTDDLT